MPNEVPRRARVQLPAQSHTRDVRMRLTLESRNQAPTQIEGRDGNVAPAPAGHRNGTAAFTRN